jgi:hypothetical protein
MSQGFPSETDRQLAAAASRLADLPISDRQVKRWRGRGLIGSPDRAWPGYARGSRSSIESYPPGTIERVATIARWATDGVSLNDITILLFVGEDSYPMSVETVRRASASLAESVLDSSVWRDSSLSAGLTERAELAAAHVMKSGRESKAVRGYRKRLGANPAARGSRRFLLRSGIYEMLLILEGYRLAAEEPAPEVFAMLGVPSLARFDPKTEGMGKALSLLGVDELKLAVKRATLDDFYSAREAAQLIARLAPAIRGTKELWQGIPETEPLVELSEVWGEVDEAQAATLLLPLLSIQVQDPDWLRATREQLREWIPQFEAGAALAPSLSHDQAMEVRAQLQAIVEAARSALDAQAPAETKLAHASREKGGEAQIR